MSPEGSRREALIVITLCFLWYTISSGSNVIGKVVLTEFPYPLTVTMVQLLSIVLYSAPAFALCGVRRQTEFAADYYWRVLVPLAFAKFLTTMFSQVSLWKVPVSYAHTVKASTPLWTAALGRMLLGERVSARVGVALLLIAGGVGAASLTERQFHGAGLAAALASAALLALQHLYSKRVMRHTGLHHLRLLQTVGRVALMMFTPVWLVGEGWRWWWGWEWQSRWSWRVGVLLVADGALSWLQAVVAFSVLSRVSPLSYAVMSAAKRAAVVGASLVLLGNPAPPANIAAMATAALGVLLYNSARVRSPHTMPTPHASRPLLPV